MNQSTDQIWVYGPGTLTQMASRGFLTDKSAGAPEDDRGASGPSKTEGTSPPTSSGPKVTMRTTSLVAENGVRGGSPVATDQASASKPTTRAGRPLSEKVPMTIGFSERMEFAGRSIDPEGRPAGRA